MKAITGTLLLFFAAIQSQFAVQHIVTNSGATFTPDLITIQLGDTVIFILENNHNVVEVTKATWNVDGNTPKPGGFTAPFGGGMVIPSSADTFFYVCDPHASIGMKGRIVVEPLVSLTETAVAGFSLFPNPASSTLFVELANDGEVVESIIISSLLGQISGNLALNHPGPGKMISIPVAGYARGSYILHVQTNKRVYSRQFLIE